MSEELKTAEAGTLDQSEIDNLLAQTPETFSIPDALFLLADGTRSPAGHPPKLDRYDFRNPIFLPELELRRLRMSHEDFARYLASRLSLYLRMDFDIKVASLTTCTYEKFTESLPDSTHLSLFKVEPLMGVGVLDVHPRLALTIADRLLGGHGHSVKAERRLTEIETALIEDVIAIILEEWCAQWKADPEIRPNVIGHENNGRFLQTSPKDAIILSLKLSASVGDCSEVIQLGVPYHTIEPLVKSLQVRRQKDSAAVRAEKATGWQTSYDRITMPVRAEWAALELSLREIVNLRVGDVIELPATICNETRVLLNGTPKFMGTVGLDTDRVAVQITRKIPVEDFLHAKPDRRKNA